MNDYLLSIIAIIVSIFSAIFVALTVGFRFALGFRESEAMIRRRKEINANLKKELEGDFISFLEKYRARENIDNEMLEEIESLGDKVKYTSLSDNMLEASTHFAKRFLRALLSFLIFLVVLIFYAIYYYGVYDVLTFLLIFMSYSFITAFFAFATYSNFRKYYFIREDFVRLSENPNFDNCLAIVEDLEEKKIRIYG